MPMPMLTLMLTLLPCALQVKPFDSGEARRIITEQLGKPLDELFADAETAFENPIAAASLGQVRNEAWVGLERGNPPR